MGAVGGSSDSANYSYTLTDDGAVVTGYLGEGLADVVVPITLGEQPVVAIGDGAFWGNGDIRSVELPATVTAIGSNAFTDCPRLVKLSAVGVATIGDYALYGCDELAALTVSSKLVAIGKQILGSAHPIISTVEGCTLGDLLAVHHMLSEQGSVTLGYVGEVEVTDELLALNNSLDRILGSTETITIEGLWAADAIQLTNPDGSTTNVSFVEFEERLRSSGLYGALEPSKCARLDMRLDVMLEALLADARRL